MLSAREGKYCEDLLSIGEHAIKGQNQVEQRAEVPYQSDFEPYVNKEISFNKQVGGGAHG